MISATPWRPTRPDAGSLASSKTSAPRSRFFDKALITRIATAVVGIPLILLVIYYGGIAFKAVIVVGAVVAAAEAFHMLRAKDHHPALLLGLGMTGLLALAPAFPRSGEWWRGTVLVGTIAVGLWFLLGRQTFDSFVDWVLTIAIVIYTGGLLGSLISLRAFHSGAKLVVLALVLTWAYDTGAFFSGRTWGKRPFMQWVSPSKTWEGVIGGVVLAIVVALIAAIPLSVGLITALILGVAVAVAAQAGDLLESMMKRYSGVKDSGNIIPGHGGMLDRIDSLLFSGTAAYYVLLLSGFH